MHIDSFADQSRADVGACSAGGSGAYRATVDQLSCLALGAIPQLHAPGRIWCHALRLPSAEVAHFYIGEKQTTESYQLNGSAFVLRVGRGVREHAACELELPFTSLSVYPDGRVPPVTFEQGGHEFLLSTAACTVPAGTAPASLADRAWDLILALRSQNPARAEVSARMLIDAATMLREDHYLARETRKRIDVDWSVGHRTAELAQSAGCSQPYLCRVFRQTYRTTISRYVLSIRTLRAAGMLWGSSELISEVAAACGFSDQPHLTRVFQNRFGASPGAFRRLAPCIAAAGVL